MKNRNSILNTIDADIERKTKELEALKTKRSEHIAMNMMTPSQRMAVKLHEVCCHSDHTDQCGWYYEIKSEVHDWSGHSHMRYLDKVSRIAPMCDNLGVSIEDVATIFNELKKY